MEIETVPGVFTVCKAADFSGVSPEAEFCFTGKTDGENSLVCRTEDVPGNVTAREDGWRALRVHGVLDFSLVGVLAAITGTLAENGIGLFAVSTYDTDYIFLKEGDFLRALDALGKSGFTQSALGNQ